MRRLVSIGSLVAALLMPGAASASTFDFSYLLSSSFGDFSVAASGVLTTTDTRAADGSVQVTDISGSRTVSFMGTSLTATIIGLDDPGSHGFKLFVDPQAPRLDDYGIGFLVAGVGDFGIDENGTGHVNISYFSSGGRYIEPIEVPLGNTTFTATPTSISAVPLPASAPMFGAAVLALGVAAGVKRRRASRA